MMKAGVNSASVAAIIGIFVAGGFCAESWAAGPADSYIQSAHRLERSNDLKGAEIQLRNAAQAEPANGAISLELAQVYMRLGDPNAAQAELFAAHMRGVKDEQIAPLMAQALLQIGDYGNLLRDVPAGNRSPKTESIVRTARGIARLSLGEYPDAQVMLSDAERLDPKSLAPKIALARLDLAQAKIADAGKKIDEALVLEPRNGQALEVKGLTFLMSGKVDAAIQQFTAAITANPRDVQALLDRANVELGQGNLNQADKDIKAVQAIAPNSVMALYLHAESDTKHNNFKEADDILTKLRPVLDRLPNAYLLVAEIKLKLNQPAQAEDALNKLIAKRPDQPKAYQLLGLVAMHRGQVDRAIGFFEQTLKLAPNDSATIGLLGQAYLSRGELDKASALFARAAQQAPGNANIQTARAATQFASGDTQASYAQLMSLFKGGAGSLVAGPPLVLASLQTGHIDVADAAATALVKHDGSNILYQELLAMVRIAEHDYPAAEKLYKSLLVTQPAMFAARRDLAQIYLATNRIQDAKKLFLDRVASNPAEFNSIQALADIDVQMKDYDDALKLLARAQTLVPSDPSPTMRIVAVEELQHKWPDALSRVHALQAKFAGNAAVADAVAKVTYESGDRTSGVAAYQRAAAAFPKSAPVLAHYAAALAAQQNYPAALDAAAKAAALDPGSKMLKGTVVYFTYLLKGADAAVARAESFMPANGAEPGGVLLTAEVLNAQGKRADAISLVAKWQSRTPSAPLAIQLAHLYQENNQTAQATATLQDWTGAHPDDVAALNALAELYGTTGHSDQALAQYQKLAVQRPNDPVILNNLAWFYSKKHDPRALDVAQKAVRLAPTSGSVADTLGWILVNAGDRQDALKYLGFASSSMPTDASIQYHYAFALSKDGKQDAARSVLQKLLNLKSDPDTLSAARSLLATLGPGH